MIRRDESGYSMVEVLVAIVILMIAIIPMFTMFDVGLRTATTSSNYDKARSLAQKHLEFAQSMEYDEVVADFPERQAEVGSCPSCEDPDSVYDGFRYEVTKTFVEPDDPSDSDIDLIPTQPDDGQTNDEGLLRIDISVVQTNNRTEVFKTSGVIAR